MTTKHISPQRIQLSRLKGWRMPPNTVKVDRTTRWGNPFIAGKHGDRARCAYLFRALLCGHLCISVDEATVDAQRRYLRMANGFIDELEGKNLACWCLLTAPCHADVLLEVAAHP